MQNRRRALPEGAARLLLSLDEAPLFLRRRFGKRSCQERRMISTGAHSRFVPLLVLNPIPLPFRAYLLLWPQMFALANYWKQGSGLVDRWSSVMEAIM